MGIKSAPVLDVTKWNYVEDEKEGVKHRTLRNSMNDLGGIGFKLSKMVHPDQNGFIQGRRLLFLLYEQPDCQHNAILSADAEMTFDMVEWQ